MLLATLLEKVEENQKIKVFKILKLRSSEDGIDCVAWSRIFEGARSVTYLGGDHFLVEKSDFLGKSEKVYFLQKADF